jgi:hypothetical protein
MRDFINIVREGQSETDRLDAVFDRIAKYTNENLYPDDWQMIATVLREFGYQETVRQGKFWRVLFHKISEEGRARHATIGDLYDEVEREIRFDLNRVQGFTTSFDNAVQFIHSQYNIQWDRHEWPTQSRAKPLVDHAKHHTLAVIYEVEAIPSRILWSMNGLLSFMKRMQSTGQGYVSLRDTLEDIWTGYGHDDEVVIDAHDGVRVVGMTMYDSDEHGPGNG